MHRFALVFATLVVLSGCALRARYTDFISPKTEGKEATFLLTDRDTGKPLGGVKVEMSEARNRVSVTTAADGTFTLPVEKKFVDENPVLVVTLPKGVTGYELKLAPPPPPPTPEPAPAPEPAPPSNG